MKNKKTFLVYVLVVLFISSLFYLSDKESLGFNGEEKTTTTTKQEYISDEDIPDYDGKSYIVLNDNKPSFSPSSYDYTESFELYSDLDNLGRCGVSYALLGKDLMPTEERTGIGSIKPTGWHTVKYDFIKGKYLYNRCHLIGYQLAGENANEKNLITCTRFMNTESMVTFENKVAKYIKETNNHVLYRVTPLFEGDNLIAKGVQMEASSLEDKCESICFNVFVYNVQEGIDINYKNGESKLKE